VERERKREREKEREKANGRRGANGEMEGKLWGLLNLRSG